MFGKRDFILPVQKLNNYSNIGCAFIYDTRFKGFSTDVNDKFSMPILVIYDINKHGKYLNKKVIIKGKIMEVPLDTVSYTHLDVYKRQTYFNPYSGCSYWINRKK